MALSSLFNKFLQPTPPPAEHRTVEELLAYRADRSKRGWQKQAMAYRESCALLLEEQPENPIVHGLAAAYDIAIMLETWKVPWPLICDHMDRFFELAAGSEDATVLDVVKLIDSYLVEYFESADESTHLEVAEGVWKYSGRDFWALMAKLKGPQMHAVNAAVHFLRGVEQLEICRPYLDECRNNTLWMICVYCRPCEARSTVLHLPLKDRVFAIAQYDELKALGVDELPTGRYARQKARETELASNRGVRGKTKEDDLRPLSHDVWREEIDRDGQEIYGIRTL